jgi:hypothetical protein
MDDEEDAAASAYWWQMFERCIGDRQVAPLSSVCLNAST